LAHATHLFGDGTYDAVDGEHQRVRVTLATSIPEDVVRRVNLGYLAPDAIDSGTWAADPGTLVVPDAGEMLYRLR
jgi:lactate racemase